MAKTYDQSNQPFLDLFQANRDRGIDRIYIAHKDYFVEYLAQYYPMYEELEEVYSDAVVVLFEKLITPTFTLTCTIQTYLNAIGRNHVFKRMKNPPKEVSWPEDFICEDWLAEVEFSGISDREYEIFLRLFQKMAKAKSKCYQIFQLFYYQELPMWEIAIELGYSSEANARNQKYQCLVRLRENITKLLKSNS